MPAETKRNANKTHHRDSNQKSLKEDHDNELLHSMDISSSTIDLHRSSLFRMQVTELLEECQLDLASRKWTADAQAYLQDVSKTIGQITIHNDKKSACRLTVQPMGCTKTPMAWTKKSGNAQMLPTFELIALIPTSKNDGILTAKDHLNHRYFDKRDQIMKKVVQQLVRDNKKGSGSDSSSTSKKRRFGTIRYIWSKGSHRAPVLELLPECGSSSGKSNKRTSSSGSPKFQVHLHFGMESIDWIPSVLRVIPNRCNLKRPAMESHAYNHALLHDARHLFEDEAIRDLATKESGSSSNLTSTLVLIQIWALQRGLWRNHDGWTKENMAVFLLYLLRTHRINPRMTPIQIFTVVLQSLTTINWLGEQPTRRNVESNNNIRSAQGEGPTFQEPRDIRKEVLILPLDGYSQEETCQESQLSQLYAQQTQESPLTDHDPKTLKQLWSVTQSHAIGPVFLDSTMTYNFLGDVSRNYMTLLQSHAHKSLEALGKPYSAFDFLFLRQSRFWNQWDLYFRVSLLDSSGNQEWEASTRSLLATLERALGNRINGVRILSSANNPLGVKSGNDQQESNNLVLTDRASLERLSTKGVSPTGESSIIIGVAINPETCQRNVDRGPPAENEEGVASFVRLWGKKAELRRFKDGAILQAVVWDPSQKASKFRNSGKYFGGCVEDIVRHIIGFHFKAKEVKTSLPSMLSVVDGTMTPQDSIFSNPEASQKKIMDAYESLSKFLKEKTMPTSETLGTSELGLPLAIDMVEPMSPSLRYCELFPQIPHPLLGGNGDGSKRASNIAQIAPVTLQLRFGSSSKWPTDLRAIAAAKAAMLIQLANGIESYSGAGFHGKVIVTPTHLDVGYKGYSFRVVMWADPEIKILQSLTAPTPEASQLLTELRKKHVTAVKHHFVVHAVYTLHPSAGAVVRMAKRWLANHMLSGLIPDEAIELIVAKAYSDEQCLLHSPGCVTTGFLHFLQLLACHDWRKEPLIVDPRGHLKGADHDEIHRQFDKCHGSLVDDSPVMYIVAPHDSGVGDDNAEEGESSSTWQPSIASPEAVVLHRLIALAQRSYDFMLGCIRSFDDEKWSGVFSESQDSFKAYDVLLRVDPDFALDELSSSTLGDSLRPVEISESVAESAYTRSLRSRYFGPDAMRRNVYKNMNIDTDKGMLLSWKPIQSLVDELRTQFGRFALIFYNDLCPEVIGIVWRPEVKVPHQLSVMTSEYVRMATESSTSSRASVHVVKNRDDILREMSQYWEDIVTSVKVFSSGSTGDPPRKKVKLSS